MSLSTRHFLVPFSLAAGLAACGQLASEADPFAPDDSDVETFVAPVCSPTQICTVTGSNSISASTYRVGATLTSRGRLLQLFTADSSSIPAAVTLRLRQLRSFNVPALDGNGQAQPQPALNVGLFRPANPTVPIVPPAGYLATGATPLSTFVSGASRLTSFDVNGTQIPLTVTAGATLEPGTAYALEVWTDDLPANGTGSVLVGVGSVVSSSFSGGAFRQRQRLSGTTWGVVRPMPAGPSPLLMVIDTSPAVVLTGAVSTHAGSGAWGDADAADALQADFRHPIAVVQDSQGNLFALEQYGHRVRKIAASGTHAVTTFAGDGTPGYADGTGTTAQFQYPNAMAIDGNDNLYVTDPENRVIRKITPAGVVSTYAGTPGVAGHTDDADALLATFGSAGGLACDAAGNLYVSDNNFIRRIAAGGTHAVTTLAGDGTGGFVDDPVGTNARFLNAVGLTVDPAGSALYVADKDANRIRRIDLSGTHAVTTVAGSGAPGSTDNASGTSATFDSPYGVSRDPSGNLVVADWSHKIRKITLGGANPVTTIAGDGTGAFLDSATGAGARFFNPTGTWIDSLGRIFVADMNNFRIRLIQ